MPHGPVSALLDAGRALHRQGELERAEALYREALELEPDQPVALKLLAVTALDRRDLERASEYVSRALAREPSDGELLHLTGSIRVAHGDWAGARSFFVEALKQPIPERLSALVALAGCDAALGAWAESLASARHALELDGANLSAQRAAAQALHQLGQSREAFELFERILARDSHDASAWHASARILQQAGRPAAAYVRAARAAELAPDNAKFAFRRRALATAAVPDWHFNMMNDAERNASFAAAIGKHVAPDSLVLEIGTGSGLLALLAATRAPPPRRVVTCEGNVALAEAARRIVAANGLSDRVTVVPKPSTELVVGVDLPERADLLIAEIFSVQIAAEGALPTFEDAKERLLKPGAPVIPGRAVARGALVGGEALSRMVRVGTVLGFDLSAFNAFTPVQQYLWSGEGFEFLSEPVDLIDFELANEARFPPRKSNVALTATRSGRCEGVVQWLKLDLDTETSFEQAPTFGQASPPRHWAPVWYPFVEPRMVERGQTLQVSVTSNRLGLRVEPIEQ